jgi:hypothetical protein
MNKEQVTTYVIVFLCRILFLEDVEESVSRSCLHE